MDVPKELKFINTSNPYEDDENGPGGGGDAEGDTSFMTDVSGRYGDQAVSEEYQLAQAAYPAYATHGLEALSAVASQDQYSYAPQPAPMTQHDQSPPQHPATSPQNPHSIPSQNLDFILNPSAANAANATSPAASNIDPRLHSPAVPQVQPSSESYQQNPERVRTHSHGFHMDGLAYVPKERTLASIEEQLLKSQS